MSKVISVYSRNAYKEFRLPAGDNRECAVLLERKDFDVERSIRILLEIREGDVFIKCSDGYTVTDPVNAGEMIDILPGKTVKIVSADGDKFVLTREDQPDESDRFVRLDISGKDMVTIGRGDECDIRYDHFGLVSRKHAVLKRTGYDWEIESLSKNGIYVNAAHIMDKVKLFHGDHINIIGLHLIFLGEALAMYDALRSAYVSDIQITAWDEPDELNPGTVSGVEDPGSVTVKIEQPVVGTQNWKETYEEYLGLKEKEIKEAIQKKALYLESEFPSSGEYLEESWFGERSSGGGRLPFWHRHPGDPGFMMIRVGRTEIKDPVRIDLDEEKLYLTDRELADKAARMLAAYRTVKDLPLMADLDGKTAVWIGETRERSEITADDLLIQLAAHIPPSGLRIAMLSDGETFDATDWDIFRMLPHLCRDDLQELSGILIKREAMTREEISREVRYVILISDISMIKGTVFERYIKLGNYLGFTVIAFDQDGSFTIGSSRSDSELRLPPRDEHFRQDELDPDLIEGFVKRIQAAAGSSSSGLGPVPEHVTLASAAGIKDTEDINILQRWAEHRTYDHIKCVIGVGAGGAARYLDLHEKYNGPHVLAAGMTGSGKSELLKTMVLSLAMEYSPEDINFILIDFKGGSMANSLAGIPHSAGRITNLSGGEIERAMLAVKDEIKERQIRLADAGVSHIDDYIRLREDGKAGRPMPHLVIVIDEFAELKKEKPDLMAELITIAQTGRSLGIHLILATQRPDGNVDGNIRSNVRTDICLRVQDKRDSEDVLGKPDAAFISHPGRAYIRMGEDEVFDEFQTALAGTDENVIKSQLAAASARAGMRVERLWLDPLEKEIDLNDVLDMLKRSSASDGKAESAVNAVAGMADDPETRSRYPLALGIPEAGNIAVVGMPSSGKTTLLYTLLASLRDSDTEISILALDSGRQGKPDWLRAERYVCERDLEAADDLLDEISEEIQERKASGVNRPYAVVAIDSYEDLRDITGYSGEKKLADMMREAESAGVIFIITGGGYGLGQITGGAEKTIKTTLCLRQRSIYDYMDALHTKDIYRMPDPDIKGRGMALINGRAVEFQTAVCTEHAHGGEDR
ncbi:MAG: FHA domain-containing protein [Eubacterium sp.]|nr:FHA domain-containing protein [Eubacterium sp.]